MNSTRASTTESHIDNDYYVKMPVNNATDSPTHLKKFYPTNTSTIPLGPCRCEKPFLITSILFPPPLPLPQPHEARRIFRHFLCLYFIIYAALHAVLPLFLNTWFAPYRIRGFGIFHGGCSMTFSLGCMMIAGLHRDASEPYRIIHSIFIEFALVIVIPIALTIPVSIFRLGVPVMREFGSAFGAGCALALGGWLIIDYFFVFVHLDVPERQKRSDLKTF